MKEMFAHLGIVGWIHFMSSVISLITGTWIILSQKATSLHKKIGYLYVASMVLVIMTAFMIYRLFGGFGIFHGFAILSTIALVGGMYPMLKKTRTSKDFEQHATVMGWSVVGLYCAFISEMCVRLNFQYAVYILFIGCGLTTTLGNVLIKKTSKKYLKKMT